MCSLLGLGRRGVIKVMRPKCPFSNDVDNVIFKNARDLFRNPLVQTCGHLALQKSPALTERFILNDAPKCADLWWPWQLDMAQQMYSHGRAQQVSPKENPTIMVIWVNVDNVGLISIINPKKIQQSPCSGVPIWPDALSSRLNVSTSVRAFIVASTCRSWTTACAIVSTVAWRGVKALFDSAGMAIYTNLLGKITSDALVTECITGRGLKTARAAKSAWNWVSPTQTDWGTPWVSQKSVLVQGVGQKRNRRVVRWGGSCGLKDGRPN